jgi:hypothetical protein
MEDEAIIGALIPFYYHKKDCLDADRGEKESGTGRPKTFKWS